MWDTDPAAVGTDCWARTADPRNLPVKNKLKKERGRCKNNTPGGAKAQMLESRSD